MLEEKIITESSEFFAISYLDYLSKINKLYNYTLFFDGKKYLYLLDNKTNEYIYDKILIKQIMKTNTNIKIDDKAKGKYYIKYNEIPELVKALYSKQVLWCIAHRG
jgi:uncharacterized protein with ATP-grasp and redox domains